MIRIDEANGLVITGEGETERRYPMASDEAFRIVSAAWLRCGWDVKYVYGFTWMGRPIIQLPDDLVRIQEVIHRVQPDIIIETGIAHGGSLVFYAGLLKILGRGHVIGIDVEIRPHNRAAIEAHPLKPWITLIEGDSINPATIARVAALIEPGARVLALLDSNHTKAHVLAELEGYGPLVSPGSYIVAMDGIKAALVGAPRGQPDWAWDNPAEAAREFLARHPEFIAAEPEFPFNEGMVTSRVTYWPGGFLKRVA